MATPLPTALQLVLLAGGIGAASARALNEYNPAGVPVREVHMVLSSHFDAGCKVIFSLSLYLSLSLSRARARTCNT